MAESRKLAAPFITVPLESSDVPIYRQVYEVLRRRILSGGLSAKSQMPSTRSLARQLAVSRMTVVTAYEQLTAEGYIEGKSGSGTYVAAVLPEEMLETKNKENRRKAAKADDKPILSRRGGRLAAVDYVNLRASRTTGKLRAFHFGLPALDAFPFDVWARLAARRLQKISMSLFGSGNSAGYEPLRAVVAAYLQTSRAVRCSPEQVIIVAGAQQALSLIAQVLLDERDHIWLESPGYPGARDLFRSAGARILSVPIDAEGFDLNFAVRRHQRARLACVTPSHQFPLGTVMSLSRRLALLEWARANDAWIIEDDYDSEFRYTGRPLPSLQGLDRDGRVLYVGTFSKTVFPALRIGCLVVPPDLIEIFTTVRALSGSHAPLIEQATLAEFIAEGHFGRHLRRMRRLYEERQEILVSEIKKHLAGRLEVKNLISGMHIIGWLPDGVDDRLTAAKAAEFGITTGTVSSHSLTRWTRGGLILGYTATSEEQIKKGVKQLAKALKSLPKK